MRISKKDIAAFFVLFLGTIVCVRYVYKHMNDEQFVATVDPYSLVVPSPTAIFAETRAMGYPLALEASALERDTRGFTSIK